MVFGMESDRRGMLNCVVSFSTRLIEIILTQRRTFLELYSPLLISVEMIWLQKEVDFLSHIYIRMTLSSI